MHKVNVIRLGIEKFVADHCSVYPARNMPARYLLAVALWAVSATGTAQARPAGLAAQDAQVILARPLFAQNRRPPPGPKTPSSGQGAAPPRLSGIVIAARSRHAIFDAGGHPAALGEGDRIGLYVVRAIGPQQVVLDGPNGPQALGLSFDSNRPTATTAPYFPPSGPSILDRLHSHVPFHPPMPHLPTPEEFVARMAQPPVQSPAQ